MKSNLVRILQEKGVQIPNPETVYISEDVNPDRISGNNVVLFSGTKIIGSDTLILDNCRLGFEAPVTLENTYVGANCQLNGGLFRKAVFAGDNTFGSGAHVREGTILEEQANAAHTVGLKQTILFPFVTLGSLINFCDCFMAGGTSRKDHSEVGSSFIHFNYSPNQDKATASMLGDVARGVMLKSRPIFLGGQGGLVGPVKIEYGCTTAAGSIIRKNELRPDRLMLGMIFKDISMHRQAYVYKNITHIFNNNVDYIASLIALKSWYENIRTLFVGNDLSRLLLSGMQNMLICCIQERISRFKDFQKKLLISKKVVLKNKNSSAVIEAHDRALAQKNKCIDTFEKAMNNSVAHNNGQSFIRLMENHAQTDNKNYITSINHLTSEECELGTNWLRSVQTDISSKLII